MDCPECLQIYQEQYGWYPPCDQCQHPGLMPENLEVWELWATAGHLLVDGMGGISLANAKLAAEALGLEWDEELMVKLSVLVAAVREASNAGKHG